MSALESLDFGIACDCHHVGWKWPKSGSKAGSGADFVKKKAPTETHFGPTSGPLPANDEESIFDPLLCQINCLTIVAPRDL